jgi:DNA-3-methyladenine glycosylase
MPDRHPGRTGGAVYGVAVTDRLPRSFFERPSTEVGPDLLGAVLVRTHADGTRLAARILEVEAYEEGDPASHSYKGRPTARTEVMFGPPGHMYVYFHMGRHFCSNVVTGPNGVGSAVLLRAAEPLEGLKVMAANRGLDDVRRLCAGPACLAQAYGITRTEEGTDLVRDPSLYLVAGTRLAPRMIATSTRVGVNAGGERPWRFFERGSAYVSPGRPWTG